MDKILYVTDLDGTLLNTQSRLSQRTVTIINSLVEQGLLFTYATARSLTSARPVTKGLSAAIPVIGYNGAFIFAPSGEVMLSKQFQPEQVSFLRELLCRHQVTPLVYSLQSGRERVSWVCGGENPGIRYYLEKRRGDPRFRPLETGEELYAGTVFYITCIGERDQLLPVYQSLQEHPDLRCTLQQELYRPEYWCEIMPKDATKAQAVLELKRLWDCDKVICFGDAVNDIPMFQIADEAYAVSNGVEELKQLATGMIGSNDQDGVALWLQEHGKLWPGNRTGLREG